MARKIPSPTEIQALGTPPKLIHEYIGHVNSGTTGVSIAKMTSPEGWSEPGQTPDFDEYTVVLQGILRIETETETLDIHDGEAVIASHGEWVRYSTPFTGGAEYIAVCLPAFSPDMVHRDNDEDTSC